MTGARFWFPVVRIKHDRVEQETSIGLGPNVGNKVEKGTGCREEKWLKIKQKIHQKRKRGESCKLWTHHICFLSHFNKTNFSLANQQYDDVWSKNRRDEIWEMQRRKKVGLFFLGEQLRFHIMFRIFMDENWNEIEAIYACKQQFHSKPLKLMLFVVVVVVAH